MKNFFGLIFLRRAAIYALPLFVIPTLHYRSICNPLPNDSMFTAVLQQHVHKGNVDYEGIKQDTRFARYIGYLKDIDTAAINSSDRLAFWINMYNAWTIKVVIDHYPVKSIVDIGAGLIIGTIFGTTVWDKDFVEIKGGRMSLNDIEHEIVRKYGDARIHFALVCASKSCPPLRREAYVAGRLDKQLDDQARQFLSDTTKNKIELGKNEIRLSKIFDWFEGDFERDIGFGKRGGTVTQFVARFLPTNISTQLLASEKNIDIEYFDYDWSLNE